MSHETVNSSLESFVGSILQPRHAAQDAVNTAMIRHWVEAMGIDGSIHLDDDAARATGREQAVAPATMMQSWTQRGYAAHQRKLSAEASASAVESAYNQALIEAGYTGVVATDSEFTFERELVAGDHVYMEERVESISAEKITALGRGRFVDLVRTYTDETGEIVATQRWRTLRFAPTSAEASSRQAASVDVSLRPHPALNRDNSFWFEAAREHRLVIQRCTNCGELRHPPSPACPHCRSFDWDVIDASGRGVVYSFTVAHHPKQPGFDYPLVVAVVQLDEGTRLITNIVHCDAADVTVGARVQLAWQKIDSELTLPVFTLTDTARQQTGVSTGASEDGGK